MILTIDIGNSNIVFGVHKPEGLVFSARIKTDPLRTDTEHAVLLSNIFALHDINAKALTGAAISSVVPNLTPVMEQAVKMICDIPVLAVGPGVKTGLNIRIDDPSTLAADLCCTAVGAMTKYPLPAIIVDLGTATKITVVDANKAYIGGAIAPGVMVSLGALAKSAALLPAIGLSSELKVICTETVDAMMSGSILGTASMVDGMIDRFSEVLGEVKTVVACGGPANAVIPHCRRRVTIDNDLLLDGLLAIYKKNV